MKSQVSLNNELKYDAVLIGAGIMSGTLALLLSEVLQEIKILIVEKLAYPGMESTGAFNNAGTGHAANCELNYTPLDKKGNIQIDKAIAINQSFEKSLELWASLYEAGKIDIKKFLRFLPHISFVSGEINKNYLFKRFELMSEFKGFQDMEFSNEFEKISSWAPLITEKRNSVQTIAATRVKRGTDINFEALNKEYLSYLLKNKNVNIEYKTELKNLYRSGKNEWELHLNQNGKQISINTKYVFLGAGGETINLLQKSRITEGRIYGGFPVSGKWLICDKSELTSKHNAKVYGKAEIGSPPMSVPHLDTRWINGKKYLLYGPFAGFTTKFLREGSYLDLFRSFKKENISSIFDVGYKNLDLIKYLFLQTTQNHLQRIENLNNMLPSANPNDWYLKNAGQRVQIIKKTKQGGTLNFGTEIVNSSDGSLSALLGASPGASTAVDIMIDVLKKSCFFLNKNQLLERNLNSLFSRDEYYIDVNYLENIKRRNNEILGFHE